MVPVNENFSSHLTRRAKSHPDATALICPRPFGGPDTALRYSNQRLEEESEILARGLLEVGIGPGVRSIFMIQPGFHFFALAFALFKAGGVLVGIDPGMGRGNMTQCLKEADPAAFIGIPAAHFFRRLLGWGRETVKINISTARRTSKRSGQISLSTLRELGSASNQSPPEPAGGHPAIIAFTSGSTGVPKGVVYSHALLNAQVESLRDCFGIEEEERDLVTFPHFAFFGPALGATLVLATMDFARPGRASPARIVRSLRDFQITNLFGSPALLNRVGRYGTERNLKLPALRRVVSAGAPVPGRVVREMTGMLEGGTFYTPYGATEALPVTCITGDEILTDTQALTDDGRGVCVGKPLSSIDARVIRISDEKIDAWSDTLEASQGEIGEIAVSGPVVSEIYFGRPQQTSLAKIPDGTRFFHRMGDLGYYDSSGRLWFCGRKSQRIIGAGADYFTVPIESVFNTHPEVFRSAVVGVRDSAGHKRPALCVQLNRNVSAGRWNAIRADLLALAGKRPETAVIQDIVRHKRFPVDRRHNAKIVREELSIWAEKTLR
jgi:acyl-CoA synthetase (AMP-forming)/AMP-acid ligase II